MKQQIIEFNIPMGVTEKDIESLYEELGSKVGLIADWVSRTVEGRVDADLLDKFRRLAAKKRLKEN